jgi:restriction endonuclease Mrr
MRRVVNSLPTFSIRLVLIDGPRLAELMIEHGVIVQAKRIVEVDEGFFT